LITSKLARFLPSGHKETRGVKNEGFSHYVIENKQRQKPIFELATMLLITKHRKQDTCYITENKGCIEVSSAHKKCRRTVN
jgi:hypothetical protein